MRGGFGGWSRLVLLALDGFVALTAVGGGLLLVLEIDRFPAEWLADSPFADYRLPGLILIGVGLVAGGAFVAALRRSVRGGFASVLAAVVLLGWLAGEVVLLQRNGAAQDPRSPTEALYAAVAVLIAVLGLLQLRQRPAAGQD